MVLDWIIFNEINLQLFFVLNKVLAVSFTRTFKKINPHLHFFSAFSIKSIHSFSFVLNIFTDVPFIRSFKNINPQWYFFSACLMKLWTVLLCFKSINSRKFYQEFQQNKSPAVLYLSIFTEINTQLFFV